MVNNEHDVNSNNSRFLFVVANGQFLRYRKSTIITEYYTIKLFSLLYITLMHMQQNDYILQLIPSTHLKYTK